MHHPAVPLEQEVVDQAPVAPHGLGTHPGRVVHLLNAPAPAATASLEIARHVVASL